MIFTRDEISEGLCDPGTRSWRKKGSDAYLLTAKGKRIRAKAEPLTELFHFALWSCLNESELKELSRLAHHFGID